jgi:AcrR family transcriptional regulator
MPMKSQETADATTDERILVATWKLLGKSPDLNVRMADIAAAAGVSRQAVYLHFGNRANLLLAAVRHRDRSLGLARRFVDAAQNHPLPEALGDFVRAWLGYIPHIQPVARLLSATAKIDPEAAAAWEDRMALLRGQILVLASRLEKSGFLRVPWTAATAADWIWHRTHVDGWGHLIGERGWSDRDFMDAVADSLARDLLVSDAAFRPKPGRSSRPRA